ncbi:Imidazoleglycerol-phosphate dehydratase [Aliarcobacter thereius]|uniref:Imidazoleglycerol-phosphate dehydratase n=2 Tax=Aliarcobacter thereius TaxID=544718 RepID=A0A1C0B670_9BACT|nr:imidazoleglycerol-phosphate dehydratase HisB [Aliarcobacter thereius]OCL86346.1 Imidazoleglycerol-phosphate dehydratase [Aliarcobacter thereius]OCL90032.1 Imidazoleglycerol-phosphate dehydratase [Aliarcobacter thereius]OCL96368.1 Imidazoleglycerol-phosphate dehydratase [Aliarcobacter thereius LMG 24486]OCL98671.1 Imidazoleglycerol-phosphate dehydratase [Aliarcobacter thereius]QBF15670.1 imidazoleglycerol-phosphate dehydratase [Aliarcobacter thereius LMG 24486]
MVEISRETKETQIKCSLELNGCGKFSINTGVGFFDHMLEALSKHSGIDINLECNGDLHIDAHHTVEDCGIVLGQALKKAIFPIQAVERYGNATVVMDEASTTCALDLSNRPFLVYEVNISGKVGEFDVELVEEFFHALSSNAGITLHLISERGRNKHHIIEATFKAFAVALRRALVKNEKLGIPSTKGVL